VDQLQKQLTGDLDEVYSEQNLRNVLEGLEKNKGNKLQAPDTSDLYTKKPTVDDDIDEDAENPKTSINGIECHPIFNKIVRMINDGLQPIIIIAGKERTGKSHAAAVIAHKLHQMNVLRGDFKPIEQLFYRPLPFLTFQRGNTRRAKLFEEWNETLNKNDYNSVFNRAVARSERTQGKRGNPSIYIGPEYQEGDPRIRDKVDVLINLTKKRHAQVTRYEYDHGKRSNKGSDYKFYPYPSWKVPTPPQDVMDEYDQVDESYKGQYLDELIIEIVRKKLEEIEEQTTASI